MRGSGVVALVFLLAGTARGWDSPVLSNVCNSAAATGGAVVVQADCIDSINPLLDVATLTLFYSTDEQATWQQVLMTAMAQPGYDSTFEGSFPAPSAGTVYYYVRGDNVTNYGTQSPCNFADTWPVPDYLLAEAALEGAGDTINDPDGEWLDLTSCAMGYSDGWLYGRITNDTNVWPLNGGILGPWYLYSVGFRNSEAASLDTLVYAMVHLSILTYTNGLYELNTYETTYTKIGNIDVQISGNRLIMRCEVSDLVARRGFRPWPNQCGYLCAAKGETRSANLSFNSWQHDTTNSSRFYVNRTPRLAVGQNTPPGLTLAGVEPDSGTGATDFNFHVHYVDADSNLPVLRRVVVDADSYDLVPNSHRYAVGVTFSRELSGFEPGRHEFRFAFDDGAGVVTTPLDTFVVTAGAVADAGNNAPTAFSVEPNPFRAATVVSLAGSEPSTLSLCDAQGRVVRTLTGVRARSFRLDLRSLPAGVYFLREDGSPLRRLLVKLGH
jgi:hypothetical protein